MAQRLVTSFVNTVTPGAYIQTQVISQPVGLGSSGIVVIFGESAGGQSYQNVNISTNVFTPNQLQQVTSQYISGPIVDAFRALSAPSNDANINGTANNIYIVKTNQGTKASAIVAADTSSPSNYGTLQDLNWGLPGNLYQYQILSTQAEVAPMVTGNTISSFPGTYGASFTVRLNGGAVAVAMVGSGPYSTGAEVAASITGLPSGLVASGDATSITLTVSPDAYAYSEGWGKSFELIDSTPGDLAALGLSASLIVSSEEPSIEVDIVNSSINLNETLDVASDVALFVGYKGTTATLTIASGMLTTTVTGGSGANLSISLSQYNTVASLAAFIDSQTGYSAMASSAAQQLPASVLDSEAAIGICSSGADLEPGRVKKAAYNFQTALATSTALQFVPTATAGLPMPMTSSVFLSDGLLGSTLAADVVNVVNQLANIQCNIIIPLFSQDASEDIEEGNTDPDSTYTIAAVNALVKDHCIQYSTPKLKRNRICVLSYWDNTENTYQNAKSAAQSLANYRCSLCMQESMQVNSQGVITTFLPWYTACVAAGMQAGGFYKSITNKLANVSSFVDPVGFSSSDPGDVEDALSGGLMFLTSTNGGPTWVSDQTTYGLDTNFVYNSMQAVYDADILALDLAASFQAEFVGQSLADVDAATALSFLSQKMDGYKKLKLIAASSDAPLGFKNASVMINGPEMDIAVEIKLATAIYFIPITLSISQVQQSA